MLTESKANFRNRVPINYRFRRVLIRQAFFWRCKVMCFR